MAFTKKVLIAVAHGTYGHHDDCYGAVQLANGILAKGGEVTMFLRADGIYMAMKAQDPKDIGLPNNLDELADFVELGGVLKLDGESAEERGLNREDMIVDVEFIARDEVLDIITEHDFCLTF